MSRPKDRAFTLLEVVLAVSLTAGLMGAAFAFYNHLARTRTNLLAQAEAITARRAVMDRITAELRSAIVYSPGIGIQGQVDEDGYSEIRFMAATLPGPSIWAVRDGTEQIPPEHDVRWVGYRLRVYEDDDGLWRNDGLERTCQTVLVDRTPEEEEELTEAERPEFSTELLAPQIKFVYFRFHNGGQVAAESYEDAELGYEEDLQDDPWKDNWRGRTLPLAVEVTLGAEPLPEAMEIDEYLEQYETYRRVIYIPGTTLVLEDALSQGGLPR